MNILKELTTFFKISSHKERRTARSLPHHAADATLTSVALTSTTASLLFCFGLLWPLRRANPPPPAHVLCVLSQDFMSLVLFPSLCPTFRASSELIKPLIPPRDRLPPWRLLSPALPRASASPGLTLFQPVPEVRGHWEDALSRFLVCLHLMPLTMWYRQEWGGERARAHAFLQ